MLHLLESAPQVPVLATVWFCLVAVLWLGYFFLEGFDYGVAMLIPVLGKNDKDKRVIVNTIGPVWDGNEVWLLTAGGAMFAAFPGWYASLFSGLYLPLLLVLVGLILRGVAFEYRSKHPDTRYRNMLDWFATIGSFLPSLVFGVGFANFIIGLANDNLLWNGSFWGLFGPFALLGGVMLVTLFLVHGSAFIALKTKYEIHERAEAFGGKAGIVATVLVAAFVLCQNIFYPANSEFGDFTVAAWICGILAIVCIAGATLMIRKGRDGWGFILTGATILTLFIGIFIKLYGNLGFAQDTTVAATERLNIITAASSETTLTIMMWAAIIFVPIVLAYQCWSYWVFHRRISTKNIPDEVEPAA
ncbi:cytochrome d ubiquinol oxidase subunit II [Tessaracoccus palaemonis]|uniref:Cytochrome d ubiquinol oxidase subunit II n=1 Tax=Tessaracoccus palaemonis TaxID=2829499 RepID=A0ABX8SHZ4_9ACTN|nr:cytochrome d ubiquinol oxidase subunit II [Tessaracoccus palaemonis]QXT62604.1 cytochrome d ubiquinol oxidase subunit II [Tessaracoccus palaemonis]